MNENIYKKIPLLSIHQNVCPFCQTVLTKNYRQRVYGYTNNYVSKKVEIVSLDYCSKCNISFCNKEPNNDSFGSTMYYFSVAAKNKKFLNCEIYSYPIEFKMKQRQFSISGETLPDFCDELVSHILCSSIDQQNVLAMFIYEMPDLAPNEMCVAYIVTDTKYNRFYRYKGNNTYKVSDPYANMLQKSVLSGEDTFFYQGVKRKIHHCFYNKQYKNRLLGIRQIEKATFSKPVSIDIHKLKGAYCSKNHTLETVTANIISARSKTKKSITVFYCYECNEYFINQDIYREFCKINGLPPIKMMSSPKSKVKSNSFYDSLSTESDLHMYGYYVSSDLKNNQLYRIRILEDVIDTGLMEKADVISHIERLIYRNKSKKDAIERWKSDLDYVRSYKENRQRIVWGEFKDKSFS